jgi:uncharacterized protein
MKSYLPDINVWLALVYEGHQHHTVAFNWFEQIENESLYFCRITQLGFLRLLTQQSVMAVDAKSLRQAWNVYDSLHADSRIAFAMEPADEEFENLFRKFSSTSEISPKRWSDAYLLAFAAGTGLELVTFDRALAHLARTGKYLR